MEPITQPQTMVEAVRHFADQDFCLDYMIPLVWPKGVSCRHCQSTNAAFLKSRRIWKCRDCRKQFSIKTGTIMEDSPLGLDKWLVAMWLISSAKNGISSWELHRALGVTQKTAWFMLHRIRLSMQTGSFEKLGGDGKIVEADESYIGGKARNMHKKRRDAKIGKGTGSVGKTIVAGLLERKTHSGHSKVVTTIIPAVNRDHLHPLVIENVKPGTTLSTDAHSGYVGLGPDFIHKFIDHAETYVRGSIHTNGMENFWSLLKRSISGTYVAVEPFHLFRYVDEQAFRFNNRGITDGERIRLAIGGVRGKRLMYKSLIGNNQAGGN